MSRVHLTFFKQPSDPDDEPSARSARHLADVGVNGAMWEPEAFSIGRRSDPPSDPQPDPAEAAADPLAAFESEPDEPAGIDDLQSLRPKAFSRLLRPPTVPQSRPRPRSQRFGLALLLAIAGSAAAAGHFLGNGFWTPAPAGSTGGTTDGRAVISSSPPGALVFIDGVARGATPIDLTLGAGTHTVQLQNGSALRTLPLEIAAGQISTQYIELPVAPTESGGNALSLSSPPPAGRTSAPPAATTRNQPSPSSRQSAAVSTRASGGPQRGAATAGAAAGRAAGSRTPLPPAAAEGWVNIGAPFPVQVSENGRELGSTTAGPLRLPAGLHTLELVNPTFEFRTTLAVRVAPGETTITPVTVPTGLLSVNALPWAEVFVDGRPIGTTPLANIAVPIGSREVLWRHPQHGERRQLITVTARTPIRIGTDFNR
jgi:hypothetical protein